MMKLKKKKNSLTCLGTSSYPRRRFCQRNYMYSYLWALYHSRPSTSTATSSSIACHFISQATESLTITHRSHRRQQTTAPNKQSTPLTSSLVCPSSLVFTPPGRQPSTIPRSLRSRYAPTRNACGKHTDNSTERTKEEIGPYPSLFHTLPRLPPRHRYPTCKDIPEIRNRQLKL